MLNCLIVDDEKLARETLTLLIQKHCTKLKIVEEAWDKETIEAALSSTSIDVLFLDIQLGDTTIFEILKHEDVHSYNVVLTTAYSDYAMKAYDLSPLDYILKPITKEQLIKVEQKLLLKTDQNKNTAGEDLSNLLNQLSKPEKITISDRNGIHLLLVKDIMYCIGEGSYTNFYMENGEKFLVSKNLKVFEDKLTDKNYFRIHKSCLINFDHIKTISKSDSGSVIMSDEKVILLSKRKKQQLLDRIDNLTL